MMPVSQSSRPADQSSRASRREWTIAIVVALAVAALLQVPYALGYILARPDTQFTGLMVNVEDGSYLSAIGQGMDGAWLYRIPFTTEEQSPALIEEFYLALGHAARALGLTAEDMWHVARIACDVILFISTFGFVSLFLASPLQRFVAYLLAILGAGVDLSRFQFDWLSSIEAVPTDLHLPEAHLFFSALTYPHFALSIALVLITFSLLLRALGALGPPPAQDRDLELRLWFRPLALAVAAGIGNLMLAVVFPFLSYLMAAVAVLYSLALVWWEPRRIARSGAVLAVSFGLPAPLLFYYQLALAGNPVLSAWNAQATTLSPNPVHYVLTYIWVLPFAFAGIAAVRTMEPRRRRIVAFLWTWVGAVAVLLYTPVTQQRRFVEGVQVPLAILATIGMFEVVLPALARTRVFVALSRRRGYSADGLNRMILVGWITLSSLTSAYLWVSGVALLGWLQPYPLFRPIGEIQAMDWLRGGAAAGETVLSSYWTGSYLPSRSGDSVFIGGRYETLQFDVKRAESERFFDPVTDDAWRQALLRDNRIGYVFFGRGERDLGSYDPSHSPFLKLVFRNSDASLYRVELP